MRLPDPSSGGLCDGKFRPRLNFSGLFGFEDVQPHDIAGRVMQDQTQKIKLDDAMQPRGEFVEQFLEIPVLRDGFGDLEKRAVLRLGRNCGRLPGRYIVHVMENNTRIRRSSTQQKIG